MVPCDAQLRFLLADLVFELERREPAARQLDLREISRPHARGVDGDDVVEGLEHVLRELDVGLRRLHVNERALDVEHELPRRVLQLQIDDRFRQRRLFDAPLPLAASLDDVVAAEDRFVRADPRVHERRVGTADARGEDGVRAQRRGLDGRVGDLDVQSLGGEPRVALQRQAHGNVDRDRVGRWTGGGVLRRDGCPQNGGDRDGRAGMYGS